MPTEAEWEYAARGPDNLIYPWGNEFVAENVVYSGNSGGLAANIGSRLTGVSWVGALNISGNVWEWVSTIYDPSVFPYPYATDDGREDVNRIDLHVLRGGGWGSSTITTRASLRYGDWFFPTGMDDDIGFRCARSL